MLAVRMFGSINANIIIVFTPIKIPNKLTLIIYIIRSAGSNSHTDQQREIFKFSLFSQNPVRRSLGGKPSQGAGQPLAAGHVANSKPITLS